VPSGSSRATISSTCGSGKRSAVPRPLHKRRDHFGQSTRDIHEFEPGAVAHRLLFDVDDAAVDNAPPDDDGLVPECQAQFVERINLKREWCFDLDAAASDLRDGHREKHHHIAIERSEDWNALLFASFRSIGSVGCRHAAGLYHAQFIRMPGAGEKMLIELASESSPSSGSSSCASYPAVYVSTGIPRVSSSSFSIDSTCSASMLSKWTQRMTRFG